MDNLFNVDHISVESMSETDPCRILTVRQKQSAVKHAIQIMEPFIVTTMEGPLRGKARDYLMIGVDGEKYPIDKNIYERTYEEVYPIDSMDLGMDDMEAKLVELYDKGYKTIAIELTHQDYEDFNERFTTYNVIDGNEKAEPVKYKIGSFVSTVNPRIPVKIGPRSVFVIERTPSVTVEGTVADGFMAVADAWEIQQNEESRKFKSEIDRQG